MTTMRPLKRSHLRFGRALETGLALLAALAAGGAGGYLIANRPAQTAASQQAPPITPARITALGRLQPAGGVVPVFGPPGDRIAKLYPLDPGKKLEAGEPIAELASRADRLMEVEISKTQYQEAITSQKLARLAGETKIRSAEAELAQARANRDSDLAAIDAKKTYLAIQAASAAKQVNRLMKLRMEGVKVADEDLDKATLAKAQADAESAATAATYKKTETTYAEMEKAATAKVAAAHAELDDSLARIPVKSSQERLKLAEKLSQNTIIKAPITGIVLRVSGHEGQPTGIEPILQMADLQTMTVVAEVYESDVGRLREWVRKGPVTAAVESPALPRKLTGTVRSEGEINRIIARNQVFAMGPREDADRRVVEVAVNLATADAAEAGTFVGMQVTVSLEGGGK